MPFPLLLLALMLLAPAGYAQPHEARTAGSEEPEASGTVLAGRALWMSIDRQHTMDRTREYGQEDPWVGSDKLMHLGVSFMMTLSTQYFLTHQMDLPNRRAWPVSAATVLTFGLFKELADSQRSRDPLFSWRDMTWNVAGVSAAVAVILL